MAVNVLLILLLVGNSNAFWDSNYETRNWSFECTEAGLFCANCNTLWLCLSTGAEPILSFCPNNQVCGGPSGYIGCVDYLGSNGGDCDCENIGNRGFLADPYDASKYIHCVPPEYQYFKSCPEGQLFRDETKSCMQITTTTPSPKECECNIDSITTSVDSPMGDPTCQTFDLSLGANLPPFTLSCPTGEAFDISKLQCVPKCDLAPPSFTCEGKIGFFADTVDCRNYHLCINDNGVYWSASCYEGTVYDQKSLGCVDAATNSDVCPEVNPCWRAHCDACNGTCPAPII